MAHILMIANSSWNLQHFRRPIIRGLLEAGHALTTVSPDRAGIVVDNLAPPHRTWSMHRSSLNPVAEAPSLHRLRRLIAEERPDLIFSFTVKPNIYGSLAGRLMKVPVVPNVSGLGSSFLAAGAIRAAVTLLYKVALGSAPRVFFQNGDDELLFVESRIVSKNQALVVPGSGIDIRYFVPQQLPRTPRFLMVSRLLRDKGVREYVAAAGLIKARIPDATFALLGDLDPANPTGISASELEAWVTTGNINHLGSASDVRPFLSDASVVVLPSYREGLPRSLLEGAAMARPLIATDVPGCRALVREGNTGFLCAARDATSLADAMTRMALAGHEERVRLGANARAMVVNEFDEQRVVSAYLEAVARFAKI